MRTSSQLIINTLANKRKHDTLVRVEKLTKHLKRSTLAEALGWIGSAGLLSGYFLLSIGIISGDSIAYYVLSGVGALGLAVVTYRHRAFQSFLVNVIFMILATIALIRIIIFS